MAIRTLQDPPMTTLDRDALVSPKPGMTIFNTDTQSIQITNDGVTWVDPVVTPTIQNVDDLIMNDAGEISVAGASTSFNLTNNSQGTGPNMTIAPGENIIFKSLNLQSGINITFPFSNNIIGTVGNPLFFLYTEGLNVKDTFVNALLGTDGSKDVVSVNLMGDITTTNNLTATLATVNANVGTFGDATTVSQVTVNGKGLVTAASDVAITFPTITLQTAYDAGASTITLSPAKQPEIIGIDNVDPAAWNLYTPVDSGVISSLNSFGNNSVAAQVLYGEIDFLVAIATAGVHSGRMEMRVPTAGVMENYLTADGGEGSLTVVKDFKLTGDRTTYFGEVVSGTYTPRTVSRIIANGIVEIGAALKASTVAFRVEQIVETDPADTQIIGYALDFSGGAGSEIGMSGFVLSQVRADTSNAFVAGDSVATSVFEPGRVRVAPVNGASFGVAAEAVGVDTPFTCWVAQRPNLSTGHFLQTADGPLITATIAELPMIGTGIGTLLIEPNTLTESGYKLDISGNFSSNNGDTLTLRLVSNFTTTPIVFAAIVVDLENATSKFFELEANFTVRATGGAGVGVVATNMDFTYNRNTGDEFVGKRGVTVNSTTFDTAIPNELCVTAEFNTASANNSIQTVLGTLNRTF